MKLLPDQLPDALISFEESFMGKEDATAFFQHLYQHTPWRQDTITVFGKTYPQPRLTALYATNNKPYSYSNITMVPLAFTPLLQEIKEKVEAHCGHSFTTCLLNLYRDGSDSNGWHADNEKELGRNPVIASVSLGASRWFHLKHRYKKDERYKIELTHGSLLIMEGSTQHFWLHQIPKTKRVTAPRINLTFRTIR